MWVFILNILLYFGVGYMFFYVLRPNPCELRYVLISARAVFLEAKNMAVERGEAVVEFSGDGTVRILSDGRERVYRFPFRLAAPSTSRRACSNAPGIPSIKSRFRFSSKGMKDISGTVYLACGDRFFALSVVSPTGGITLCVFDGVRWVETDPSSK